MNSLIILVTICAFFVAGVRSGRPYFCPKIEDNEENTAILFNCISDHYPEAIINLVTKCYRQEFGVSDGTWQDLVIGLCDDSEIKDEQLEKYRDCLDEGEDEALSDAGISKEEAERDGEAGERCIFENFGPSAEMIPASD